MPPASRVTATCVDAGARGSQQRSRTGTTQTTKESAASASAHRSRRPARPRTAHELAPARASAGHSPRSVRAMPSS